ncbi:HWE histidine kinase domain-containing protein [Bradyrhizobium sp. USDA 372]
MKADFPTIGARTMLVSARRLVHPDNNSTSILILFEDVSERRHSEAKKDILLSETRRRMKNLLGIIRSLANQTENVEDRSAKEFRDAFLGRLQTVSGAESLGLAGGTETDLGDLVEQPLKVAAPELKYEATGLRVHINAPVEP